MMKRGEMRSGRGGKFESRRGPRLRVILLKAYHCHGY
jgi:hypothetical protein